MQTSGDNASRDREVVSPPALPLPNHNPSDGEAHAIHLILLRSSDNGLLRCARNDSFRPSRRPTKTRGKPPCSRSITSTTSARSEFCGCWRNWVSPHEIKRYQRNAETRLAPPELAKIHPLGKSPVITDGDTMIASSAPSSITSSAATEGRDDAGAGSADYEAYNEWLHYSEGSAMLPLMLNLYASRLKEAGAPLHPRIDSELANHLGYVDGALKGREFFVGPSLTGADIQMSFVGEMAKVFGKLEPYRTWRPGGADARPAGVPAEHRKGRGV